MASFEVRKQQGENALLEVAQTTRNALAVLPSLEALNLAKYLSGALTVHEVSDIEHPQGLPVDVDINKKTKQMTVTFGVEPFEVYVQEYADQEGDEQDLLRLFVGFGFVHDLAIRALSPERTDDFIEHITKPNGLYGELFESGMIDSAEHHAIIQEFILGDDDRIAKVNVSRFAIGAVCEALAPFDPGFRARITNMFRPALGRFLESGDVYIGTASRIFDQRPEKAQTMFAEHIKDFDLAAAFPKNNQEVAAFVDVY